MSETNKPATLKRSLTLPLLVFYGVGTILGVGIYVLLGKISGEAGTLAPFSFFVAALIALFTGLSYGELGARIPKSAGEVNFVQTAFNIKGLSMMVGYLIVLSAIVSTATIVNGYVGYVHVFYELPPWLIIIAITLIMGGIAIWGITESAVTITIITLIELGGLIMVVAIAGENLADFPARSKEFLPKFTLTDWKAVFLGAYLAFFAFIGFEDLVNVAEEARNPERDIPRSIIISLIVITILYILIALIASLGLTTEQLDNSKAPLATILEAKGAHFPMIISAIGLVGIINGILVQIVMGSRVLYGMAKNDMAPKKFAQINSKTRTPIIATVSITLIILFLALTFNLEALAKTTNFIILFAFLLVNLSLIRLKHIGPPPEGIRQVSIIVPYIGFVLTLFILIFQLAVWVFG